MTVHIDEEVIPRFEEAFAGALLHQYPTHVGLVMERMRTHYAGRILATYDEFRYFLETLDFLGIPEDTPGAIMQQFHATRMRLVELVFNYQEAQQAITAPPMHDIVDGGTAERLAGMEPTERNQTLEDLAAEYLAMMHVISPEALASALETRGELSREELPRFIGLVNQLLDGSGDHGAGIDAPSIAPGSFLNYDPSLLNMPTIREYVIRILRRFVYAHLHADGADDLQTRPHMFASIGATVEHALHAVCNEAHIPAGRIAEHAPLFGEIIQFYEDIVHLDQVEIPELDLFVDQIPDHHGVMHAFPSLRQLIATRLLVPRNDNGGNDSGTPKQFNCARPGDGKTPIGFLVNALRNARRAKNDLPRESLVYILPPHTLWDIVNQARYSGQGDQLPSFFLPGRMQQTDIGVIHADVPSHERQAAFTQALQAPYVFCANSMLQNADLGDPIFRQISSIPHYTCVVDEAHDTAGGGGPWSKMIRRMFLNANVRLALSGTPTANKGIDGAFLVQELLVDPLPEDDDRECIDRYLDTGTKYRCHVSVSIAQVRARLNDVLLLDAPHNHRPLWTVEELEMNQATQDVLDAVVMEEGTFSRKYVEATVLARAPWLRNPEAESPMFERVCQLIAERLPTDRVILVNEDEHTRGMFEPHPEYPGRPTFSQRLRQFVQSLGADYREIWGSGGDDRLAVRDAMATAGNPEGGAAPLVVFANSMCLRTGISLRAVELIIRLGANYRFSVLDQEFCRTYRAGHITPRMVIVHLEGHVDFLKWQMSTAKHCLEMRCFYGDLLTPAHLQTIMTQDEELANAGPIGVALRSMEQRSVSMNEQLHTAGMAQVQAYWRTRQQMWHQLHIEAVDRTGMDPANMQRFEAALIARLEQEYVIGGGATMQIGTSGYSLSRHLPHIAPDHDRQIIHIEPALHESANDFMHTGASDALVEQGTPLPQRIRGTALNLRALQEAGHLPEDGIDCLILENFDQYMWNGDGEAVEFTERAVALLRAREVAHTIVIPLHYTSLTSAEFNVLVQNTLPLFGWQAITEYTGPVRSTDDHGEPQWRGYSIVARRANGNAPTRATIQGQLTQSSLHCTHKSRWPLADRHAHNTEITARLLPYPSIATQFRIECGTELAYERDLPHQALQQQHRAELIAAVELIRQHAPTAAAWQIQRPTLESILHSHGIAYASGQNNPGFFLQNHPQYTFYPYEEKWAQ